VLPGVTPLRATATLVPADGEGPLADSATVPLPDAFAPAAVNALATVAGELVEDAAGVVDGVAGLTAQFATPFCRGCADPTPQLGGVTGVGVTVGDVAGVCALAPVEISASAPSSSAVTIPSCHTRFGRKAIMIQSFAQAAALAASFLRCACAGRRRDTTDVGACLRFVLPPFRRRRSAAGLVKASHSQPDSTSTHSLERHHLAQPFDRGMASPVLALLAGIVRSARITAR
jgi:hypothetical protein